MLNNWKSLWKDAYYFLGIYNFILSGYIFEAVIFHQFDGTYFSNAVTTIAQYMYIDYKSNGKY